MSHIFHRQFRPSWPVAVSAQGITLTDAQGRTYLDASGGAAVSCLGHGHPEVMAAMHAQIDRLAYTHTSFFTTEVAEQLAAAESLFFVGLLLFLITLGLNIVANRIVRRVRQKY